MAGESESIIAYFGGDTTGLQNTITKAHAMTGKFAADSAKVFQEIGTAEKTLADFRAKADMQRGAAFNKDLVLQREILQLKKQIDAIEGITAEKMALQLSLEQKQLQLAQQIAAIKTSGAGGEFTSSALGKTAEAATKTGTSFSRLFSVAGALKGAFSSLVGISAAMFAPAVADRLARWITGFSKLKEEALELQVAMTGKAADEQEANLAKLREAKEKEARDDIERAESTYEIVRDARLRGAEMEKEARDKEASALKGVTQELAAFERQASFEKLSDQQKVNVLKKEESALSKNIKDITDAQANGLKLNSEETKQLLDDKKKLADVQAAIEGLTVKTVAAEKQITKEVQDQLNAKNKLASIAGIRGGRQFNEASDETLAEVVRRNQNEAQAIKGGKGGFGLGQDMEVARLLTEAENASKELEYRRRFKQDLELGGVEMARANFQGDPLQFDRTLQSLTSKQEKSTTLLQSLDDRLAAAGFQRT